MRHYPGRRKKGKKNTIIVDAAAGAGINETAYMPSPIYCARLVPRRDIRRRLLDRGLEAEPAARCPDCGAQVDSEHVDLVQCTCGTWWSDAWWCDPPELVPLRLDTRRMSADPTYLVECVHGRCPAPRVLVADAAALGWRYLSFLLPTVPESVEYAWVCPRHRTALPAPAASAQDVAAHNKMEAR
jgi:hypothetical protein